MNPFSNQPSKKSKVGLNKQPILLIRFYGKAFMKKDKKQLFRIFATIGVIWTIFIALILVYLTYQKYEQVKELALLEAKTSINKDIAFRKWVATHGGVYVPITA